MLEEMLGPDTSEVVLEITKYLSFGLFGLLGVLKAFRASEASELVDGLHTGLDRFVLFATFVTLVPHVVLAKSYYFDDAGQIHQTHSLASFTRPPSFWEALWEGWLKPFYVDCGEAITILIVAFVVTWAIIQGVVIVRTGRFRPRKKE